MISLNRYGAVINMIDAKSSKSTDMIRSFLTNPRMSQSSGLDLGTCSAYSRKFCWFGRYRNSGSIWYKSLASKVLLIPVLSTL